MKNLFSILCFAALAFVGISCQQASPDYGSVDASTARQLIADHDEIQILDVRTPLEYSEGHIHGAALVDFNSGAFAQKLKTLDPSETYMLYCRSGGRSSSALKMMQDAGFEKVYEIQGGYLQWEKLPAVK